MGRYGSAAQRLVRSYLRRHDIAQPFWLASGSLIVSSGGWLWRRTRHERRFRRVFRLRYWGRGVGRGILDNGLVQLRSGRILFGEYFRNESRVPLRVYASDDDGQSWRVMHEFPPGRIRHVHALLEDPYRGDLWLCTGDHDHESFLARSSDGGQHFEIVGGGSQTWRACCVLFTPDYVYWGADTSKYVEHRKIYRPRRGEAEPEPLQAVDGAVEFAARHGNDLLAFSTSRTGHEDPPIAHRASGSAVKQVGGSASRSAAGLSPCRARPAKRVSAPPRVASILRSASSTCNRTTECSS